MRLTETLRVDADVQNISTGAGSSVSRLYDMSGYDEAMFYVSLGTTGVTISTMSSVVINLVESSAATVAGTTLIGGKAAITMGDGADTTSIPVAAGCNSMLFMSGSAASATAATTGDPFRIGLGTNVITLTYTSIVTAIDPASTLNTATSGRFGCTLTGVASTADTGGTALIDSIRTALSSTKYVCGGPNMFRFTTPDTGTLKIDAANSEKGPIFYSSTVIATRFHAHLQGMAAQIPVRAEQLTSTAGKKFIGMRWGTCAQIFPMAVVCIRSKGRYMPSTFCGITST